ncbi:cell division transport system permease protein [Sphingomonas guangdongensis]|uniref:Cell division transport system permease protein n=1 Tax=Sphingomonas guangdongensis TaxID=1141890 RepID=A0A285QFG8_9SPHN|nr:FtsX-like permease family protein [Sphingomonas guangdongensis]SOB80234.1 cell division transport system permease protein [Sphingomonas guangdongensis]
MSDATASRAGRRLLDNGRQTRAMRWVMAVMLFLTVLAGALGLGTWSAVAGLDSQLAGRMTVQLLGATDPAVRAVVDAVQQVPGVRAVRAVPRAEMAALLQPWLGDAGLDADLPIPVVIDIDVAGDTGSVGDAVTARVGALAPDARIDRAARWLGPVRSFIVSLAWLAGALVVLMATATASIALLTARSGLDTHRDTINVLHMLGSTDVQVSRLFQRRIALDTLVGGAVGTVAAAGAIALISARVQALDAVLVSGVALGPVDWLLLAALPLLFTGLAMLFARVAILAALRRTL